MPDDIPRSAHEKTPDQRHDNVAPSWWPALSRTDLPTGDDEPVVAEIVAPLRRVAMVEWHAEQRQARVHPALRAVLVVVFAVAFTLMLGGNRAVQLAGLGLLAIGLAVGVTACLVTSMTRD